MARKLDLVERRPSAAPQLSPIAEVGAIQALGAAVVEYPVGENDAIVGRRIRELGLPRSALVSLIVRGGDAIPPRGSTSLQAGDHLHILVRWDGAAELGGAGDSSQNDYFDPQHPGARGLQTQAAAGG